MEKIEVLNQGFEDSVNILSDEQMDDIVGGDFTCKKSFTFKGTSLECGCGYSTSLDPTKPLPGTGGGIGGGGSIGGGTSTDNGTISKPGTGNGGN